MDVFGNKQEEIFNLGMDEVARAHMQEAARWAKFLAILGFIFIGLLLLLTIVMFFAFSALDSSGTLPDGLGPGMAVIYVVFSVIYFYPTWALYKFSTLSREALHSQNQQQFNESLRNLKNIFKFFGIVTIIMLVLYGIGIIFAVLGAMIAG